MRIVMIGASPLAVLTARQLSEQDHEVVIVERDEDKIDELSEQLDCGFVNADGSQPSVLEDVSPENTDVLCCLSNSDQDNIIAALVGKSLGFERVFAKIEEPDFERVCVELGLDQVIVPDRKIAEGLSDLILEREVSDLGHITKGGLRFFSFIVGDDGGGNVGELELPEGCRVIAVTRDERSRLPAEDTEIEPGDRIVILTEEERLEALRERFGGEGL